jgi:two-component system sensor histidine kinase/response regulator
VDFLFKPLEPRILRHKASVFFDLYRQRQDLAETLAVNETFVAIIGHDLKNPIHAISLAADLLLLNPTDERTTRLAERIRSSSRRMVGMIDDLFDLARVRLGDGIPLERASVDLAAVVRKVVAECLVGAPNAVIEIAVPEGKSASGEWDSGRVEQVVSNLVGNALRHGAPGTPIRVSVDASDGDRVTLSVHNAGAIAPAIRETMFDPFRGASRGRARKDGLGLGLYIVQQLVVAHGGTVDVESSEADGTTFRVRLPRS